MLRVRFPEKTGFARRTRSIALVHRIPWATEQVLFEVLSCHIPQGSGILPTFALVRWAKPITAKQPHRAAGDFSLYGSPQIIHQVQSSLILAVYFHAEFHENLSTDSSNIIVAVAQDGLLSVVLQKPPLLFYFHIFFFFSHDMPKVVPWLDWCWPLFHFEATLAQLR